MRYGSARGHLIECPSPRARGYHVYVAEKKKQARARSGGYRDRASRVAALMCLTVLAILTVVFFDIVAREIGRLFLPVPTRNSLPQTNLRLSKVSGSLVFRE